MKLESQIEARVGGELLRWADRQKIDLYYLKLNINNFKGWPDRILMWPDREVLFVEFKRPGEVPSKLQAHVHKLIRHLGFEVRVYDDAEIAVREIQDTIITSARAGTRNGVDYPRPRVAPVSPPRSGQDKYRVKSVPDFKKERASRQTPSDSTPEGDND